MFQPRFLTRFINSPNPIPILSSIIPHILTFYLQTTTLLCVVRDGEGKEGFALSGVADPFRAAIAAASSSYIVVPNMIMLLFTVPVPLSCSHYHPQFLLFEYTLPSYGPAVVEARPVSPPCCSLSFHSAIFSIQTRSFSTIFGTIMTILFVTMLLRVATVLLHAHPSPLSKNNHSTYKTTATTQIMQVKTTPQPSCFIDTSIRFD